MHAPSTEWLDLMVNAGRAEAAEEEIEDVVMFFIKSNMRTAKRAPGDDGADLRDLTSHDSLRVTQRGLLKISECGEDV